MKKEYTLLTLGALVTIIPWLGLTPSLRKIFFTIIGIWIIYISYYYWKNKKQKEQHKQLNTETEPIQNNIQNNIQKEDERRYQKPTI